MAQPKKAGAKKSKVVKKKATKKTVKKKKKVPVLSIEEQEAQRCDFLINTIRNSKKQTEIDAAFEEIVNRLKPRIQKLVNRFNIAGLDSLDIMQESLYALRYKAIKDYNAERGNGIGWPPFDRFSILCIRRHLSTEYKASYQNKKRVLNSSLSFSYQSHSSGGDDELSLINIISSEDEPIVDQILEKEYYVDLITKLVKNLSPFEKEVFMLYAKKYSYEEIAEKINEKRVKVKVKVKGVDNALSRIKHKAKIILANYEQSNGNKED